MDTEVTSVWEKYKDQFQYLTDVLKTDNATVIPQENDNKDFTIDIKGGQQAGGFLFNFRLFKEEDYKTIITDFKDYMMNLNTLTVITFNAKTEEKASMFESVYQLVKPLIEKSFQSESYFRIEGTRIFIDLPHLDNSFITDYLDSGFKSSEHQDFFISLGSILKATDVFNLNFNDFVEKLLSLRLFINQKFFNMAHILPKLIEASQKMVIPEHQTVIDICIIIMKFFNVVLTAEFTFEFNPKELTELILNSEIINLIGGKEALESGFESLKMAGDMLKSMVADEQLIAALGILDLEAIKLCTIFPKDKTGSLYELIIPGLNQVVEEKILNH